MPLHPVLFRPVGSYDDQEARKKIYECAANQQYVIDAPVFLVFCADMQRHRLACEMHDAPMQSGFTEQFLTASLDCAILAQNMIIGQNQWDWVLVILGPSEMK